MSPGTLEEGPLDSSTSGAPVATLATASAASTTNASTTPITAATTAATSATPATGSTSTNRRVALGKQGSIRKRNRGTQRTYISRNEEYHSRVTIQNPKYYDPRYYYKGGGSYSRLKERPATWAGSCKNLLAALLMVSLPMSIFWLPLLVKRKTNPRVVVSLVTTTDRLPHIQSTLESLLLDQSLVPSVLYLVLPQEQQQQQQQGKPASRADAQAFLPESLPSYLVALQEQTNLQILTPIVDLGPTLSGAYYALEQEQSRSSAAARPRTAESGDTDDSTGDDAIAADPSLWRMREAETRILLVNDHYEYPRTMVESLVDASEANPAAIVAGSGGDLVPGFRWVEAWDQADSSPTAALESVPRLVLRPSVLPPGLGGSASANPLQTKDVVESRMGLIFRSGSLSLEFLEGFFQSPKDESWPEILCEQAVGDLVWSALLEARNLTRIILPRPEHGLPGLRPESMATIPSSFETSLFWMEAAVVLRDRLGIWSSRAFLDPDSFTVEQYEALRCEAESLRPSTPVSLSVEAEEDPEDSMNEEPPEEVWATTVEEACGSSALALLRALAPRDSKAGGDYR